MTRPNTRRFLTGFFPLNELIINRSITVRSMLSQSLWSLIDTSLLRVYYHFNFGQIYKIVEVHIMNNQFHNNKLVFLYMEIKMPYSVIVAKDGQYDDKQSVSVDNKEELEVKFSELKEKYQATENKTRETTMGSMGSHGLFKFATGQCKHGKEVEVQYAEVTGQHHCGTLQRT